MRIAWALIVCEFALFNKFLQYSSLFGNSLLIFSFVFFPFEAMKILSQFAFRFMCFLIFFARLLYQVITRTKRATKCHRFSLPLRSIYCAQIQCKRILWYRFTELETYLQTEQNLWSIWFLTDESSLGIRIKKSKKESMWRKRETKKIWMKNIQLCLLLTNASWNA